ncbi:flagellar hook-length control protein FliK [Paracoccus sp. NSM]|uniref:flagellar hook-length control protein FliK n=1 Tax=Paracoccus sp. NSM TaxID=3457784 RepID=UPI0040350A1E
MAAPVTAPSTDMPPTDLPASETALPPVETQVEIALRMRAPDGPLQQVSGSPPAPEPSGEVPPVASPDIDIPVALSDESPDALQDAPVDSAAAEAPEAVPADEAAPMPQALVAAVVLPDAPARPSARPAGPIRAEGVARAAMEPTEAAPAKPAPVAAMAAAPASNTAATPAAPLQTAPTQAASLRPTARAGAVSGAVAETVAGGAAAPAPQPAATPAPLAAAQVAPAGPEPALTPAPAEAPPLAALPEGASVAGSGGSSPAPAALALNPAARLDRAEWPEAMAMTLTESLPEGGTMVIELAPEELGRLRIVLTLEGDRASVQFQTETDAAARLLSQQERALAVELARNGMSLAGHDAQTGGGWSGPRGSATASGAATGGDGGPDVPPPPPLHRGIVNLIA